MIREAFPTACASGKVFAVKSWQNENSSKNQVSVQFAQEIEVPQQEGTSNLLVAVAQGIENAGKNIVTAIFSIKRDVAEKMGFISAGSMSKDFTDSTTLYADDVFKTSTNIQVTESHTPNPLRMSHEPKVNPSTGEVITSGGQPVYRETSLVSGTPAHVFLPTDRVSVVTGSTLLSRMAAGEPS